MAAGALIVSEAGGMVTQMNAEPFDIHIGNIVATNGRIHDEMLKLLK